MELISKYSCFMPQIEAEILVSHAVKCARQDLYTKDIHIDEATKNTCDGLVEKWLNGEPIQYITGSTEFMDVDFIVNESVLIPRPETEILVKEVLLAVRCRMQAKRNLKILDLCTGSGNIAISLARELKAAKIIAVDISGPALKIARKNSDLHGTEKNVIFYKGDLFQALPIDKNIKFDIIVCNPPYVKRCDLDLLQVEVKKEPSIALDGGDDGLNFYRRIAREAKGYLSHDGALFLEVGFGQLQDIIDIFGVTKVCKIKKDFAGIDRVLWINL